jgi:hypothetical protein
MGGGTADEGGISKEDAKAAGISHRNTIISTSGVPGLKRSSK